MQYVKLPKTICDGMEKIQRGFLWVDKEDSRKPHRVGWDICCLSKKDGGAKYKELSLDEGSFSPQDALEHD